MCNRRFYFFGGKIIDLSLGVSNEKLFKYMFFHGVTMMQAQSTKHK